MSTNHNVNETPNAATLLEFANLQIAAEALYRQENITKTASVGWVLAPTRLNMTNNAPIFQAA